MPVEVTRIYRLGSSLAIHLNRKLLEHFPVRQGDVVGIRQCGEKLIVERIPLEKVAIFRTGEPEMRAE